MSNCSSPASPCLCRASAMPGRAGAVLQPCRAVLIPYCLRPLAGLGLTAAAPQPRPFTAAARRQPAGASVMLATRAARPGERRPIICCPFTAGTIDQRARGCPTERPSPQERAAAAAAPDGAVGSRPTRHDRADTLQLVMCRPGGVGANGARGYRGCVIDIKVSILPRFFSESTSGLTALGAIWRDNML